MKYYRFKGRWKDGEKKIIIAEMIDGREKYHGTVPRPDALLEVLRQDGKQTKPSPHTTRPSQKRYGKGAQSLLSEPPDLLPNGTVEPEEDEIELTLKEMQARLKAGGLL